VVALTRLLPEAMRPKVVVEVHGDWRIAARLYGGPARRWLAGPADRVAAWAVRHADTVRVISSFTGDLARQAGYHGPILTFPAFTDLSSFEAPIAAPPATPSVVFLGVLEKAKGIDTLLAAWPAVLKAVPAARLMVAGDGRLRDLVEGAAVEPSIQVLGRLEKTEVAGLLDRATLLVVPSRSEGLGRVVLEAMARGRAVVASNVGGLPDLVSDGITGALVPAEDPDALAVAIVGLLGDPSRVLEMGVVARRRFEELDPTSTYTAGIRALASVARDR